MTIRAFKQQPAAWSARLTESFITAGVDVGASSVKVSLLAHGEDRFGVVVSEVTRLEGREGISDARAAVRDTWSRVLSIAGLSPFDVALVASTGTGDQRLLRAGHFYRRLSQTVGARHLYPDVGAALDIGAQQIRCAVVEPRSGVRRYFLTSRCASWDGDLVNRSGVCDGLAAHVVALLRRAQAHGPVALIGGMVRNEAFVATLRERLAGSDLSVQLMVSPEGLYAGSYGAALLAARRYQHLSRRLGRDRAMPYTEMLRQIH